MIDLHCHILPGLDDGAATVEQSLAMARAALEGGVDAIVATPHVRDDYPNDASGIDAAIRNLEALLQGTGLTLRLVRGAEAALPAVLDVDDDELTGLCIGSGPYLLLESPYVDAGLLEPVVRDLLVRGFRPILAHPERCPAFQSDRALLERLAAAGALCSITAGSLTGMFGGGVRRFAVQLVEHGLVQNIASDAHDERRRPPRLASALAALEEELPGSREQASWFTADVPAAIVAGRELPSAPARPPRRRRRRLWRKR